jgi:hypothetical protein
LGDELFERTAIEQRATGWFGGDAGGGMSETAKEWHFAHRAASGFGVDDVLTRIGSSYDAHAPFEDDVPPAWRVPCAEENGAGGIGHFIPTLCQRRYGIGRNAAKDRKCGKRRRINAHAGGGSGVTLVAFVERDAT